MGQLTHLNSLHAEMSENLDNQSCYSHVTQMVRHSSPFDENAVVMMIVTKQFSLFVGNVVLRDLELRDDALVSY